MQGFVEAVASTQLFGQPYAQDAVVQVGGMQLKGAVAIEYLTNVGEAVEVVVNALDGHHRLTVVIGDEGHVLHTLCGHFDLGQLSDFGEHGGVGRCRLALYGCHLQLGVEGSEERGHEVAKAVEDREGNDECHRGNSDTYY